MNVLVSVIVPVYNTEKYLVQCIESILNQTLKEIELILVDDGSSDRSGEICDEYARKDQRVKVIHQDNQGPIAARNRGVMESVSHYITFVDGDDFVDSISYELAVESIKNEIDVISFGITRYFDAVTQKNEVNIFDEKIYNKQGIAEVIYPKMIWDDQRKSFGIDPTLCNKIIKKELVLNCYHQLEDNCFHYGEDVAVVYPLLKNTETLEIKHRSYYYHRQKKNIEISSYIMDESYFDKLYILYKYLRNIFREDKILVEQIEYFYMYSVGLRKQAYGKNQEEIKYIFPFDKVEKQSRIVIYGAGLVGRSYMEQLRNLKFCDIVLWVDKNYQNFVTDFISPVEKIREVTFDKIVIAIEGEKIRNYVVEMLGNMGVESEQIVFGNLD